MENEDTVTAGFGRNELLHGLVRRIERQFESSRQDLVEPSLVVGVFGEWGSGKSYLLERIKLEIANKYSSENSVNIEKLDSIILPIPVNPWRFEAEEHLIVPLLLQTRVEIQRWRDQATGPVKKLVEKMGEVLDRAQRDLGCLAVAFASAFKFKLGFAEIDPDKARKAFNEEMKLTQEEKEDPRHPEKLDAGEVRYLENVERPLLQLIQVACGNRSGFDPRMIAHGLKLKDLEEMGSYFDLVEEVSESAQTIVANEEGPDDREEASIDNPGEFIEALLSTREESWHGALDSQVLRQGV